MSLDQEKLIDILKLTTKMVEVMLDNDISRIQMFHVVIVSLKEGKISAENFVDLIEPVLDHFVDTHESYKVMMNEIKNAISEIE